MHGDVNALKADGLSPAILTMSIIVGVAFALYVVRVSCNYIRKKKKKINVKKKVSFCSSLKFMQFTFQMERNNEMSVQGKRGDRMGMRLERQEWIERMERFERFEAFERDRMERMGMGMEGRGAQRMSVQDMEQMQQEGFGMRRYGMMGPGLEAAGMGGHGMLGHGIGGHAPPHYKASYSESRL